MLFAECMRGNHSLIWDLDKESANHVVICGVFLDRIPVEQKDRPDGCNALVQR